jgi:hypothetical protein
MAIKLRVQHLNHSGGVVSTHTPVGGSLRWSYRATDMGDIAYELPLSDPLIARDAFRPYFTDWRLQQNVDGNGWESIAAGIHVPVNLVSDEDDVNVAGKDWAHWLEQPVWFDSYGIAFTAGDLQDLIDETKGGVVYDGNGFWDTIAGMAWSASDGATQQSIIENLIDNTKRGTDFVNINPNFNGVGWTEILSFGPIMLQDETNVIDHINTVAKLGDPYGFDWTMNWNKSMEFFGPRKNLAASPTPIWTISESDLVQPTDTIDWTNNGPLATHVVGLGQGSPAPWHFKRDQDSVDIYREWLKLVRVGDAYVRGQPDVEFATEGLQYIHPQKDLKITIRPEDLDPFGGLKNHIGDVLRYTWDFPNYHQIDAFFWIVEQQFYGDGPGNWKCDLGLQQIYD